MNTRAGRIPESEIDTVRDLARIDEIVGAYLTLRPAGADSLKGLCPFHEEKTPSFHVRPTHGRFHCFGCGESGDVFSFLQSQEHIGFRESVELAADRVGHRLRFEGGGPSAGPDRDTRARLVAANTAAAAFYTEHLHTQAADIARRYLDERHFDEAIVEAFGCGFAPTGWDRLTKHLLKEGFSASELEAAGLSRMGRHGMVDRFRGRLVWPIRSRTGEVIGFGARRLFDDDPIDAKYLNTPETVLYRKSHVLFGLDRAKRQIAATHRAVVVEGYTDVMAMHAAGITTAVAACGTAFGEHHLSTLRRMLLDDSPWRAEMIYTFDGDAAGMAAATKAFGHAAAMPGRSSIAIIPGGRDPCELRQQEGDAALRDLMDNRGSLIDTVLRSAVSEFDLTEINGRVAAAGRARALLDRIQDPTARTEWARQVAGWCGVDAEAIIDRSATVNPQPRPETSVGPSPTDRYQLQRTVLHGMLHHASLAAAAGVDDLPAEAFDHPDCARLRQAIADSGGAAAATANPAAWVARLMTNLGQDTRLAAELVSTTFPVPKSDARAYLSTAVTALHSCHPAGSQPPTGNPPATSPPDARVTPPRGRAHRITPASPTAARIRGLHS